MKQQENKVEFLPIINLGLYKTSLKNFNREYWVSKIYEYKKQNPITVLKSNNGGWQSSDFIMDYSTFPNLCKNLQDIFYQIMPNPQKYIKEMWANISLFTNTNNPHSHGLDSYPYTKYSGILYVKVPKNSGSVRFINPLNLNLSHNIIPEEGDIIFFPSSILHFVESNLSQEDRISIAFNFN